MKIYLMTGMSGAGKSTLAKRLVEERGLRYLSIENFYLAFFGTDLVHTHEEEVWQSFAEAIQIAIDDGADILIDTNSPSRTDRDWFLGRFPEQTYGLIIVEADKEICFMNNRVRERSIPEAEMEKIYANLEPVMEAEMQNYETVELYKNYDNSGVKFVKNLKG